MAFTPLAYIATSGSGTGYAAWTGTSNVIVPAANWSSTAGPAGTRWWMSPNHDENIGPYLIAKVESAENVPIGPWTWTLGSTPGTAGNGEIIWGAADSGFRDLTTSIFVSNNSHELTPGGFTAASPTQITLIPLSGAPGRSITYTVNNGSPVAGGVNYAVTYAGGTNLTTATGLVLGSTKIAVITSSAANPKSGGTVHFWRLNTASNPGIVALARAAGIPGSYTDGVGVRTAALATNNYWVSWVNWPL
jgi:hypothetical protein